MSGTPIASIRKADGAEIRVTLQRFKGRSVVDVRVWYQPTDGGEFIPTRKGITLDIEKLPALAMALQRAIETSGTDR